MADDNKNKMPVTKYEFTSINGQTVKEAPINEFWEDLVDRKSTL